MPAMRAKVQVASVTPFEGGVNLLFTPVSESKFGPEGQSEDNTYARWTPSGKIELTVTNPELFDVFKPGQRLYVDFSNAPTSETEQPDAA